MTVGWRGGREMCEMKVSTTIICSTIEQIMFSVTMATKMSLPDAL